VHRVGFVMFQLPVKFLNIEQFFNESSFESFIGEFGHALHIVAQARVMKWDFLEVIWKFLDLRCERY